MKLGCIYIATNILTGKSYIGQSFDFKRRKREHSRKRVGSPYFDNALKKYGRNAFKWSIIEDDISETSELDIREQYWITRLNTIAPNGYNLTEGGKGGRLSEESRKKMSDAHRGKKKSDEHKRNISNALRGRKLSEEHLRKCSQQCYAMAKANRGSKRSIEFKRKMSEIAKKRWALQKKNSQQLTFDFMQD